MNHLIIIPTYNEAETIEKIVCEIFKQYDAVSILVVDDSSPDGTRNIVENLQKQYSKLYIISHEKKYGLKQAYNNGIKWGLENGFDVFTTCDADYSHDPKYIANIIEYLNQGYEAIFGSRYIKNGANKIENQFKKCISIFGNIYARLILGNKIYDWTEGFNTFTKSAVEKIGLNSIKAKGYILHAESKYKAIKAGCKYIEFPIVFQKRCKGYSKMDLPIVLEAFVYIIKIRLGL